MKHEANDKNFMKFVGNNDKKTLQDIAPKKQVDLMAWPCLDRKHCESLVASLPKHVRSVIK